MLVSPGLLIPGVEDQAREAFNAAINKYAKHGLAYERRGYVNYKLGNIEDALYDFNKSITLHPANPDPQVGAAVVKFTQEKFEEAIPYLDNAIKNSIPHQPVYWQARRLKAEAYNALGQHDLAVKELKLFTSRKFDKSNPNFDYVAKAYFDYGKALLNLGEYLEAIIMFDKAILFIKNNNQTPVPEILPLKTEAMEKAGKNPTLEDSVVK
jgi:tetratricopeptide (TPR) repeat protein